MPESRTTARAPATGLPPATSSTSRPPGKATLPNVPAFPATAGNKGVRRTVVCPAGAASHVGTPRVREGKRTDGADAAVRQGNAVYSLPPLAVLGSADHRRGRVMPARLIRS